MQYFSSGLSLVDPSAAPGVFAIRFKSLFEILFNKIKRLLIIPLTPFKAPNIDEFCFFSCLITPTSD